MACSGPCQKRGKMLEEGFKDLVQRPSMASVFKAVTATAEVAKDLINNPPTFSNKEDD